MEPLCNVIICADRGRRPKGADGYRGMDECIGSEGTIRMPAQSWKNLDPETGVYWQEPKEWWDIIRGNIPAYDKRITPTNTMGAVAEMFRQWEGAFGNDHPARSVAAGGGHYAFIPYFCLMQKYDMHSDKVEEAKQELTLFQ